jgi:ketosteroid isomerase-like protein
MSRELIERARVGLEAWQRGDFETLEEMLAPEVELLWWEPGDWDCHGRDDVIGLLRERYEQGFAGGRMELVDAGEEKLIMVTYPADGGGADWPQETATIITFRDERAVHMQQYPTLPEAEEALR